jgi:hypothetical protein
VMKGVQLAVQNCVTQLLCTSSVLRLWLYCRGTVVGWSSVILMLISMQDLLVCDVNSRLRDFAGGDDACAA